MERATSDPMVRGGIAVLSEGDIGSREENASNSKLESLPLIPSDRTLESVSTALNQTRRSSLCLSMIFSENRFPLSGSCSLIVDPEPVIEAPEHSGQNLRQILRNQPRTRLLSGFAMHPDADACRLECRYALRQKSADHTGQHVA